jgi:iron complex transport system substrate-binding protein
MTEAREGLKVVSLLPSATELICAAGGEKYLVGRSHECDYPPSITDRAILTAAINKFESCKQVDGPCQPTLPVLSIAKHHSKHPLQ